MYLNRHLEIGVDTTLLKIYFAMVTDAVGALRFPVKYNNFPPTVNLVRSSLPFMVSFHRLFYHKLPFCLWGI